MDQLIQKAARKPGYGLGGKVTYRYATKKQAQLASRRILTQAEKNKSMYKEIKGYITSR